MAQQEIANAALSTASELPAISLASTNYWCQTKSEVEEFDFEWTIERLAFFENAWEPLTSAEFSNYYKLSINLDTHSNVEIRLILDLPIIPQYDIDLSNIQPTQAPSSTPLIKVELAISNEKCKTIFQNTTSIPKVSTCSVTVFKVSKKALLESGDFVNGKITIYCKIRYLTRNVLKGKATATERYLHKSAIIGDDDQDLIQILHQLEELFEKMTLSDVTFNIRGRKLTAHKNILAMRSPVFAAMFQHPTKEALSGQVKVDDIDPDVLQEVLRYMYTGLTRSAALDVMAPALLAAADKYLLKNLIARCETHLIHQMSAKNCLDVLVLTTHHPAEHLKKFALEYFRRYPSEVMGTDNWKKMKEENSALLCDLMQQMVLTAPTV